MFVSVKNNSPAPQGVHTLAGVKWIKPGATQTIEVEDTRQIERLPFLEMAYTEGGAPIGDLAPPPASLVAKVKASDPLDHDGDGKAGGSKPGAGSTSALGAARKRYKDVTGKKGVSPKWDLARIEAEIAKEKQRQADA